MLTSNSCKIVTALKSKTLKIPCGGRVTRGTKLRRSLCKMNSSLERVAEEEDEEGASAVEQLQSLRVAQTKSDNKVRINVGGIRHETYKTTLLNIPDTRLAWLAQSTSVNSTDYDPINREFYFDRHPRVFEAILNFYRTGKLHAPCDVCGPLFEDELQFWGIDEKQIEPCCWSNYTQHRDAQETLAKLTGNDDNDSMDNSDDDDDVARIFGIQEEERQARGWYSKWQPRVWLLLEDPYSSRAATVSIITTTNPRHVALKIDLTANFTSKE